MLVPGLGQTLAAGRGSQRDELADLAVGFYAFQVPPGAALHLLGGHAVFGKGTRYADEVVPGCVIQRRRNVLVTPVGDFAVNNGRHRLGQGDMFASHADTMRRVMSPVKRLAARLSRSRYQ